MNLVISREPIHEGICLTTCNIVGDLITKRSRKGIMDTTIVQALVIYTYQDLFRILLILNNDQTKPLSFINEKYATNIFSFPLFTLLHKILSP